MANRRVDSRTPLRPDPPDPAVESPIKLLRPANLVQLFGVSLTSLWRWRRSPEMGFPKPFKLGANSVAYDEAEVRAWLATRRAR